MYINTEWVRRDVLATSLLSRKNGVVIYVHMSMILVCVIGAYELCNSRALSIAP